MDVFDLLDSEILCYKEATDTDIENLFKPLKYLKLGLNQV